jgi:hypothetical protein
MEEVYRRENGWLLGDKFQITTNISAKKLANAKKSFAKAMGPNEIPLMLFDGSTFGNGKAGFLLTNSSYYCTPLIGKPAVIILNPGLTKIWGIRFVKDELIVQTNTQEAVADMTGTYDSKYEENQAIEVLLRILSIVFGLPV